MLVILLFILLKPILLETLFSVKCYDIMRSLVNFHYSRQEH